jgi:hypothetical protein
VMPAIRFVVRLVVGGDCLNQVVFEGYLDHGGLRFLACEFSSSDLNASIRLAARNVNAPARRF